MQLLKPVFTFVLTASVLLFSGCDSNMGGTQSPCESDFDQQALFQHVVDALILPGYAALELSTQNLQTAASDFAQAPSPETLDEVRTAFQAAYLNWQDAAQYEFGPAEEVALRATLNNFPLNINALESRIVGGAYDFANPNTFDKGFPALDYLLYGLGDRTDGAIVAQFEEAAYAEFLTAQTAFMAESVKRVHDAWKNGYRDQFLVTTGTAAGASLSQIINGLNEHYEMIKRDKLGIPSGVVTLGFTNPDKVEAPYSGLSLALAQRALLAAEQFYLGVGRDGQNGPGLDDYLEAVNATKEGESLNTRIQQQFDVAKAALAAVPAPLRTAVDENNDLAVTAYNEIARQIVNLKTDMPSVLCVAITYIDNPSDSD
ncbi:MAG: imelysin family protein [Phaeodactylibacter sp.]|uniref:imelysin family protein n=1 Tax=Phaeodactylibacter sp. TaxID=1940289 RepID=UPI0032EDF040